MSDPLSAAAAAASKEVVVQSFAILDRVVGPVATELGEYLRGSFRSWRTTNANRIAQKAKAGLDKVEPSWRADPRAVAAIFESGSWTDNDQLQDMWANLLVTSMSADGNSDETLLLTAILNQMTAGQAKILKRVMSKTGVLRQYQIARSGNSIELTGLEWLRQTGVATISELSASLDSLRSLNLVDEKSGYQSGEAADLRMRIYPTTLCMLFYARTQGHFGNPKDFYPISGATKKYPNLVRRDPT